MSLPEIQSIYSHYVSGYDDVYLYVDQIRSELLFNETNLGLVPQSWTSGSIPQSEWEEHEGREYHITHGYASQGSEEFSRIQISLPFMMVVIVFNGFKLMVMLSVLMTNRSQHLVTLGDITASFLERPDPNTEKSLLLESTGVGDESQRSCKIRCNLLSAGPEQHFYVQTLRYKQVLRRFDLMRKPDSFLLGVT